jgi:pyruvate/oxaloacetate carboxyltransferase
VIRRTVAGAAYSLADLLLTAAGAMEALGDWIGAKADMTGSVAAPESVTALCPMCRDRLDLSAGEVHQHGDVLVAEAPVLHARRVGHDGTDELEAELQRHTGDAAGLATMVLRA